MRILIAVPTYENIYPDTFKSIYDLDKCGHECLFEFIRGYDVAFARNTIATRAIELDADYVFMVDNDVVLPKNALRHLTEDIKDVQLGVYARRTKDAEPGDDKTVIFHDHVDDWSEKYTVSELNEFRDKGIYKLLVRGGGMGCALIKTDVFKQLRFPYFQWVHFMSGVQKHLSEDLFFCDQCRGYHIPIYTDTRVRCGHIIRYIHNSY